MTLVSIGRFIQDISVFTAVRESAYVYPILLATHVTCIAIFGGLILLTNLRLLGWVLADIPVEEVIQGFRAWKQLGFVVMVCCGLLLGASKAEEYLGNPFFQLKMALLIVIGVHGLYFRRRVYRVGRSSIRPTTARVAAVLSLILWVGVVSMGRWIAYYDPPSPTRLEPPQSNSSLATS